MHESIIITIIYDQGKYYMIRITIYYIVAHL